MFVELLSCWAAMELEAVGALLKNEYLFPIFRKGDSGLTSWPPKLLGHPAKRRLFSWQKCKVNSIKREFTFAHTTTPTTTSPRAIRWKL